MKRTLLALAVIAVAAAARAEDGAALFQKRCSVCHGKDGKGTPAGQKMGAKDLSTLKESAADVEKVVTNGKGKMTAFKGKLSEPEIKAVSTYVANGLK